MGVPIAGNDEEAEDEAEDPEEGQQDNDEDKDHDDDEENDDEKAEELDTDAERAPRDVRPQSIYVISSNSNDDSLDIPFLRNHQAEPDDDFDEAPKKARRGKSRR